MARRPEHERTLALEEPVRLHPNDWSSAEAVLLECSEIRFRARCEALVRVGCVVALEVPGIGAVKANVTWRRGHEFAATFATPIDLARASLFPVNREILLARLLKERAVAHATGSVQGEQALRVRIRDGLPLRRLAE